MIDFCPLLRAQNNRKEINTFVRKYFHIIYLSNARTWLLDHLMPSLPVWTSYIAFHFDFSDFKERAVKWSLHSAFYLALRFNCDVSVVRWVGGVASEAGTNGVVRCTFVGVLSPSGL
ncbi:hypothetical protein TNCV_352941 [Trichonephila clavipes]|nr:hypothetical protein TNCV_352941 [Trichonephila clavipes]